MSAADGSPVSAFEAQRLFGALSEFPSLILAVSGGPDSTALMVLAARWRRSLTAPPRLVAVTVDHALRAQARREAAAVKRLARSLGIEHWTLRWSGRKPKTGIQEAARVARYRLLSEAARKAGARHVVTAHTLDDNAETVLLRLARGSGVGGLAGMGLIGALPVREGSGILLVRPLLTVPKSRLIATLKTARIGYADDPSNRDPRFARSRIRALMPALAREGVTADRLARLARRIGRVEDALFRVVSDARDRIVEGSAMDGGPLSMEAPAFFDLPDEIALRLLGWSIAVVGDEGPVELGKLEALSDALAEGYDPDGSTRFRRTLAGALITLHGRQLRVERAPPRRRAASKRP